MEPRGNRSAWCVDYGIGKRWTERQKGQTKGYAWKLVAMRLPERQLVFDEGEFQEL